MILGKFPLAHEIGKLVLCFFTDRQGLGPDTPLPLVLDGVTEDFERQKCNKTDHIEN